jgi:S1-C subfamily serine protease
MKKRFTAFFFGIVFFGCFFGGVFAQTNSIALEERTSTSTVSYSEQELSSLLKPSVVRVIQRVSGSATIPSFIIDKNGAIALDKNKKPATVPINNINILGSGFFVSDDGYILTNAHFVSERSSKLIVVNSFVKNSLEAGVVDPKTGKTKYRTVEEINTLMSSMFTDQTVDFILKNTIFKITRDVVVIDSKNNVPPPKDTTFDLLKVGLPATVKYSNDDFYKQGDDIALLKVSGSGFPAVDLSHKEKLMVSDSVFVFKFPTLSLIKAIDELSVGGVSVAEIASAIIVKTEVAASSTSEVYKTDLLGGDDSSGGMAFTKDGMVVGIVSYDGKKYILEKDTQYQTIMPVGVLRSILQKNSVTEKESVYGSRVRNGFAAVEKMWCENAGKHFSIATSLGSSFVPANYFDQYVKKCNDLSQATLAASQKKEVGISAFFLPIQEKIAEWWNVRWVSIALLIFLIVVLLVLLILIVRKFAHKKTTKDISAIVRSERSEEVSKARRVPLSEKIPLKETGGQIDYPNKDTLAVPKKQETIPKKDEIVFVSNERTDTVSGTAKEEIEDLPEDDQEMLMSLWPKKYGEKEVSHPATRTIPVKEPIKVVQVEKPVLVVSKEMKTTTETIKPEVKTQPVVADVVETRPIVTTRPVETTPVQMDHSPIVTYIRQTRELGFSDDLIKQELLKSGWPQESVTIAFDMIK